MNGSRKHPDLGRAPGGRIAVELGGHSAIVRFDANHRGAPQDEPRIADDIARVDVWQGTQELAAAVQELAEPVQVQAEVVQAAVLPVLVQVSAERVVVVRVAVVEQAAAVLQDPAVVQVLAEPLA